MTSQKSIVIAIVVYFIQLELPNLREFLNNLPNLFILTSICLVVKDIQLLPERYKVNVTRYHVIPIVIEALLTVFILNAFMSSVWIKLEQVCFLLTAKLPEKCSVCVVSLMMRLIALWIFVDTSIATGNWDKICQAPISCISKIRNSQTSQNEEKSKNSEDVAAKHDLPPSEPLPKTATFESTPKQGKEYDQFDLKSATCWTFSTSKIV